MHSPARYSKGRLSCSHCGGSALRCWLVPGARRSRNEACGRHKGVLIPGALQECRHLIGTHAHNRAAAACALASSFAFTSTH